MKRIKKTLTLVSMAVLLLTACEAPKELGVVPYPQYAQTTSKTVELPSTVTFSTNLAKSDMNDLLAYLPDFAIPMKLVDKNPFVTIEITDATDNPIAAEGYNLTVSKQGVNIQASSAAGAFYGLQTLAQLARNGKELPVTTIKDEPRFPYRGLHLDVSRHFFNTDYVKKQIDLVATYKINRLHWHLTDGAGWRLEIPGYPRLTEFAAWRKAANLQDWGKYDHHFCEKDEEGAYGGYYTEADVREVLEYARLRHVTVIPEIEMPGHALAALAAYPELSCDSTQTYKVSPTWGVFEQVFCPSETTFKFFEGVMDEVVELFPSEYIHIGGDECPKTAWKNSAFCQQLIRQLGLKDDVTPSKVDGMKHSKEDKLQSYFVTRMEKYLNGKGRNIIGWDEILEGGLAPNATVLSWRGVEGGLNAAKAGHNAIMAPMPYAYLDFYQEDPEIAPTTIGGYTTLKKTYSYNPVPDDADELVKKHIIGMQGNLWREYMKTSDRVDYQAFPRAMAIAETGWTLDANKNWKSFCERMVTEFERLEVMDTKPCLNFFDVNINTHADENGPLMVLLETFYPNAEIRYTTDGSEPTYGSTLYEQPFALEGNIDLKAAAFKDGKMLGKVTNKPLYGNLLAGKPFTVNYTMGWTGDIFGDNDVLGADKTTFGLTNGKRGNNASYTPWSSFAIVEGKDLEFIVHLDKPTEVRKVVFGSLFNPAMRMLPAGGVAVEVSADGQQYTQIAEKVLKHDCPETGRIAFTDSIEFEPTQATFLKVKIKNGGTLRNGVNFEKNNGPEVIPAELWIDEIEAY